LSINYNPHSKHFILFFSAPQLKKIDKNQNYAGIILDSNLKTIKYIDFSKYTFFVPECFIQFPSGKLGMPIYDNNKSIKREHFKVMVFDY
jgi:hypothetical protein